ncbi:acyl-CoA carboxylase subunit epsilon [Streptomyces sp. NBC_00291]|uniref:acyl-CoA carboxylase subunit epsilon n=1 Tax=Streptomyces sp. NBC_00291 TaxID=2975704 RepID=UPI00224D142A|nr:acyl-CoA carboxylase subunit epsilon [Streptomyces sp. NBC_00291]MCX5155289.1 acyl-CoA carboxylase subunit epsilon [Streptomyces sp. NBC_00291]
MSITTDTLLKVEKGNAAPEELAAITAILLARAATTTDATTRTARTQAGWRRLERSAGFRAPHSWRG